MDGLSGAASVIAVFSLALTSSRAVYKIVSGIKNGPKAVQQMASTLQSLSNLLQQLKGCADQFYLATDLEERAGKCAKDLEEIEHDLAKLSITAANGLVRSWKHVRVMLKEQDLERMSTIIGQHVTALSLQLQIIEGKRGISHTLSLERVEALSCTQVALSERSSGVLQGTNATVNQISDNVKSLNTSHQSTLLAIEQLGDKMLHISSLSEGQSETVNATCNAIFKLMKQQLSAKHQQSTMEPCQQEHFPSCAAEDSEAEVKAEMYHNLGDGNGLQHALDRLCHLSKEKEKTVASVEAETILQDVQHIYELLLETEQKRGIEDRKGKRSRELYKGADNEDQVLCQRDVKRIKGFMSASQSIAINEKASRSSPRTARYRTAETRYQRPSRDGTVTFHVRRKYRNFGTTSQDCIPELLEASFAFLPHNTQNPRIAVDFKQRTSYEGFFLHKPALSVSALLPENSEVFDLIAEGDLNGLIQSLSLRNAYLTDRDIHGRCLLSYAIMEAQPDICRFLIDSGADVQFLEKDFIWEEEVSPLNVSRVDIYQLDPESLALMNRCKLILFEAGADPSSDYMSNLQYFCLFGGGSTECFKLLLDHGVHFTDEYHEEQPSRWLYDMLKGENWRPESVALLLRRQGKNGLPIQDLDGCLHEAIRGSRFARKNGLKEGLILLVKGGADIYARDDSGRSVSQIACCKWTKLGDGMRKLRHLCPCKGEYNHDLRLKKIWMEALSACGYDAEEVISADLREEELSDNENDCISDRYEQTNADASDCSEEEDDSTSNQSEESNAATFDQHAGEEINPPCASCGRRGLECQCNDGVFTRQPDAVPQYYYEKFVLEGDAEVWRNGSLAQ